MEERVWFYLRNNQPVGPMTREQMRELAGQGQLQPTDLVWREGMADWLPASSVSELMGHAASPYEAPRSTPPRLPLDRRFVDQSGRVRLLVMLLILALIMEAVMSALDVAGSLLYPQWNRMDAEPTGGEAALLGLAVILSLGFLAVFVTTVVVFCKWAYRANRNARALGVEDMKHSPGWTVGWWFIPIANLFKPYMAITEIARASDPDAAARDWHDLPLPSIFGWWWAAWLVMNFTDQIELQMATSDRDAVVTASVWVAAATWPLTAVATWLVIKVIREIESRQHAKARVTDARASVDQPDSV